jgi:2-polyprenyl-6-methoxyphenol hydroxylase-like FAD-dependent oxidoreductase
MGELFDLVVVGGGLAGASLAKSMAEHGARVLVLERDEQFRDRVRGEMMIVGADGRSSMVCKTAGFHPVRDPDRLLVAGVLLDNVAAPEDTAKIVIVRAQDAVRRYSHKARVEREAISVTTRIRGLEYRAIRLLPISSRAVSAPGRMVHGIVSRTRTGS